MADRVLFIGWGAPAAGTEERGLELLNRTLSLYSRMRREGRIEGFNVGLLDRTDGGTGFMRLRGSAEQISAVRRDEEFHRAMLEASEITHQSYVVECDGDEQLSEQLARYRSKITGVPTSRAAEPRVQRENYYGPRRIGGRSLFGALPAALTRS
jgi:hypothetical protein